VICHGDEGERSAIANQVSCSSLRLEGPSPLTRASYELQKEEIVYTIPFRNSSKG